MKRKKILEDYFLFTKKDRIAVLLIVLILFLVFLSPRFFKKNTHITSSVNDTAWVQAIKKLEIKQDSFVADNDIASNYQYDRSQTTDINNSSGQLFYFDPNTISITGWEKLGLKGKTIQTIQNYLSKGGRFKEPEDLKKIYGLHPDQYERLAPYIRISKEENNFTKQELVASKKTTVIIDINTADTSAFISLPGIGSKLAARIVNFREKLGGFYSVDQIKETYGLPDSTFQKIRSYLKFENTAIKKININTATVDELKAHPYIKYSLANPIIAYRNQHGLFSQVEDVKKIMLITDDIYNKISPYLTTQ